MDCRKSLKTLAFDATTLHWTPIHLTPDIISAGMIETLSFLTYNVWHDTATLEERSTELLKILQQSSADFICLQEVTKPFLSLLQESDWVREQYFMPDLSVENYTTLILSRLPCQFFMKKWPTRMERFLLYAELEINGVLTAVATVHLESLANSRYRKKQLDITYQDLSSYSKCLILGDFNFDWATENKNLSTEYVDVWPYLNSGISGCTVQKSHDFIAWRPDRVLMKKNQKYKPLMIEKVGMEPIPRFKDSVQTSSPKQGESIIQTPSDHFGLRFIVELLDNTKEEWSYGRGRMREKNYREMKKERFVWIDGSKRSHENTFFLEELERVVNDKKAEIMAFDKVDEGVEDLVSKLDECDNLTVILSLSSLHDILHSWKKELKVIQDKFIHEKHFRFRVIVLTSRHNYSNGMQMCRGAGFEKYSVFTKFSEMMSLLFAGQS